MFYQIYDLYNQAYNFLFETEVQARTFAKDFLGLDSYILRQVTSF